MEVQGYPQVNPEMVKTKLPLQFSESEASVILLRGNDAADSTSGVFYVPFVPRDQMHMQMHDRLSGRLPAVDADVISVWGIFLVLTVSSSPAAHAQYHNGLFRPLKTNPEHVDRK